MKRFLMLFTFVAMMLALPSFAHSVLFTVIDNGDGTINVEGGLSTGGTAEGAVIVLHDKATGRPLFTEKLPKEGRINVKQPTEFYTVTLKLEDGHEATQNGPLPTKKTEVVDTTSSETEKK